MQPEKSIEILHQDDTILAVNKPAGLPVIPDGFDAKKPNLQSLLSQTFGRLWVVHRLDLDTSGILLFARSAEVHRQLNLQFEHHVILKLYHLLAWGTLDWETRVVSLPLRVNGDRGHRTVIDMQHGKPARTAFTVLERFPGDITLLSATPTSGYTHQIRAHCATTGLWLVDDPLYFPRPFPLPVEFQPLHRSDLLPHAQFLPVSRTALHAHEITFQHPISYQPVTLQAPHPIDFAETLKVLRFH